MHLFTDIILLLTAAVVVVLLFERLGLPPLLGFIAAGVLTGPYGLGFVTDVHQVEMIAELGIVLLLFLIGVELSIKQFLQMWRITIVGGGLQMLVTAAVAAPLAFVFGLEPPRAILWGMLVALSSTAIALKLLSTRAEMNSPHGRVSLGILIFQDLMVAPLILIIPLLGESGSATSAIGGRVLLGLGVGVVVIILARYAVPYVLKFVVRVRSSEVFLFAILVLSVGAALVSARAGLSAALGAFVAGLLISESEYAEHVVAEVLPFRDVFFGLFFVSIGMLFDVRVLFAMPLSILGLTVGIVAVKAGIIMVICRILGLPWRTGLVAGLFIAQVGEFAFVLMTEGTRVGLIGGTSYQLLLASAVFSMMMTPLAVKMADKVRSMGEDAGKDIKAEPEDSVSRLRDHVIIAGYGLNGQNLARVLARQEIPYVVIEMNPVTVERLEESGTEVIFGDAGRPSILEHAGIATARIMVIAISDAAATRRAVATAHRLNPACHIVARTRFMNEVEPLQKLGASEVIPEEFETAIEIFVRVLQTYLLPRSIIESLVAQIRSDSYSVLRSAETYGPPTPTLSRLLGGAAIEAIQIPEESHLIGESIRGADLRHSTGATVIAIRRGTQFTPNPPPDTTLQQDDILVLLGDRDDIVRAAKYIKDPNDPRG
ncbi:MAG: sodium:proton exchanger [candidate division Zixibacteria bacterium]|nr:sodium:proton exchanger [candidate division Zixibacteria bacterium]